MPEIEFPYWINWVILIGMMSGALTAVTLLILKIKRGVSWMGKTHQAAVLAPAIADINRLDEKLDGLLHQLTSDNNNSIREQVNSIRHDIQELTHEVKKHQKWAYERHALIEDRFKKHGLAGPVEKGD